VNIHREIAEAGVGAVSPRTPAQLAATLDTWLSDDSLRHQAAERARPFVRRTYNWQAIAANWVRHYERLAGTKIR
jgi:glycosyltransferase involved in cell wall biosynthesis